MLVLFKTYSVLYLIVFRKLHLLEFYGKLRNQQYCK